MDSVSPSWDLCPLSSKLPMPFNAPRINPKLLTMARRGPSHWPQPVRSHLCLSLTPLLPRPLLPHSPLPPLQAHSPPGPLSWLFPLPGALFPRPSHGRLLLEFGAPADMSLCREVSQPPAPCPHLHSPHHHLSICYGFAHMFVVCVCPPLSLPVTISTVPAGAFCLVPHYDLSA